MGLAISKDYAPPLTYAVGTVSSQGATRATSATEGKADTGWVQDAAEFSSNGRLAVPDLLNGLMLPAEENVRKMSAQLSRDLGSLLAKEGIGAQPPITFSVDYTGNIVIEGDRADKEQILETVNGDEKVSQEVRNTVATSSHAVAMAESLRFQREYLQSNDPESVVGKYSYLFEGQRAHHTTVVFDGQEIDVLSDGKEWPPSRA
jgi:hypothetical protein